MFRSSTYLFIQFHNMCHLVLQTQKLLLKIFDLCFMVLHGLVSFINNPLKFLILKLLFFQILLKKLCLFYKAFRFFHKAIILLLHKFDCLFVLFHLLFHIDDGFTWHLALSKYNLCFFSKHSIQLVSFEGINVDCVWLAEIVKLLVHLIDDVRVIVVLHFTLASAQHTFVIYWLSSASRKDSTLLI